MSMNHDDLVAQAVRSHIREGRLPPAQAIVSAWLQRTPVAAAPLALQVLLNLAGGQAGEALVHAQRAVASDASSSLAYLALAHAHLAQGSKDDALVCAQRACGLAPYDNEILRLVAELLIDAGNVQEALMHLWRLAGSASASAVIRAMWAELALTGSRGDLTEAERQARLACTQEPCLASAHAVLGMVLATQGQFPQARDELDLALRLEPDQPGFLLSLVQMLLAEGGASALQEARVQASRALALAPQDSRAALLLAQAWRALRKPVHAIQVLSKACKQSPDNGAMLLELSWVCVEVGECEAARQALERAQTLQVPDELLRGLRLEISFCQGDLTTAFSLLDQADAAERGAQARMPVLPSEEGYAGRQVVVRAATLSQYLLYVRFAERLTQRDAQIWLHASNEAWASFLPLSAGIAGIADSASAQEDGDPITRLPLLAGWQSDQPLFDAPYLVPPAKTLLLLREHLKKDGRPCALVDFGFEPDPTFVRQVLHCVSQQNLRVVALGQVAPWHAFYDGCQVEALDLTDAGLMAAWVYLAKTVVCTDGPLAHLAGGLGVPAVVWLPLGHDPVWGHQPQSTAWYPSLTLFREPIEGGLDTVGLRLVSRLNALAEQAGPVPVMQS